MIIIRFVSFTYKRVGLFCFFCLAGLSLFSQQNETSETAKTFDHFIGLQVNPLIRQIINFSESEEINNPYLLKYTLRHNGSGLTFNFGGGLNTRSTENEDGLKTNDDSYDIRGGLGYQKLISQKFEAGIGLDFIYGNNSRETFSSQVTNFGQETDSTITKVRDVSKIFGGGIQLSLNYYISERILIGTEFTMYYARLNDRFNVEIDNYIIQASNNPNDNISRGVTVINEEDSGKSFEFQLPIAFYLSFRF